MTDVADCGCPHAPSGAAEGQPTPPVIGHGAYKDVVAALVTVVPSKKKSGGYTLRVRVLKNLGWLLRHGSDVKSFEVTRLPKDLPEPLHTKWDAILFAHMKDGRVFQSFFASHVVLGEWLSRRMFRGMPVRFFGEDQVISRDAPKAEGEGAGEGANEALGAACPPAPVAPAAPAAQEKKPWVEFSMDRDDEGALESVLYRLEGQRIDGPLVRPSPSEAAYIYEAAKASGVPEDAQHILATHRAGGAPIRGGWVVVWER